MRKSGHRSPTSPPNAASPARGQYTPSSRVKGSKEPLLTGRVASSSTPGSPQVNFDLQRSPATSHHKQQSPKAKNSHSLASSINTSRAASPGRGRSPAGTPNRSGARTPVRSPPTPNRRSREERGRGRGGDERGRSGGGDDEGRGRSSNRTLPQGVDLRRSMSPSGRVVSVTRDGTAGDWDAVAPQSDPGPRCGHSATVVGGWMVVFGGSPFSGFHPGCTTAETHILSLRTLRWSRVPVEGDAPCPRGAHAAAAVNSSVVIYGGHTGARELADDNIYRLDLARQPKWKKVPVPPGSITPGRRYGHSMSYHAASKLLVVFGGSNGTDVMSDLWVMPTNVKPFWWFGPIQPSGISPIPRIYHSASIRDDGLIVIFGGRDGLGKPLNDSFALFRREGVGSVSKQALTPRGGEKQRAHPDEKLPWEGGELYTEIDEAEPTTPRTIMPYSVDGEDKAEERSPVRIGRENDDEQLMVRQDDVDLKVVIGKWSWVTGPAVGVIPLPRFQHASAFVGGKLFVLGGKGWNPVGGKHSKVGVGVSENGHASLVSTKADNVYNGIDGLPVSAPKRLDTAVMDCEVTEPDWKVSYDINSNRYRHSAVSSGNKILVFGGISSKDDKVLDDVQLFKVAQSSVTAQVQVYNVNDFEQLKNEIRAMRETQFPRQPDPSYYEFEDQWDEQEEWDSSRRAPDFESPSPSPPPRAERNNPMPQVVSPVARRPQQSPKEKPFLLGEKPNVDADEEYSQYPVPHQPLSPMEPIVAGHKANIASQRLLMTTLITLVLAEILSVIDLCTDWLFYFEVMSKYGGTDELVLERKIMLVVCCLSTGMIIFFKIPFGKVFGSTEKSDKTLHFSEKGVVHTIRHLWGAKPGSVSEVDCFLTKVTALVPYKMTFLYIEDIPQIILSIIIMAHSGGHIGPLQILSMSVTVLLIIKHLASTRWEVGTPHILLLAKVALDEKGPHLNENELISYLENFKRRSYLDNVVEHHTFTEFTQRDLKKTIKEAGAEHSIQNYAWLLYGKAKGLQSPAQQPMLGEPFQVAL